MNARAGRLAIAATAAAAAISVAAAAAPVTWHYLGVTDGAPVGAAAGGRTAPRIPPDIGPILALAPFGAVVKAPAPAAAVRETSLELTLHGVLLAEPATASIAYIAGADRKVASYGIGDPVGGRAVVDRVLVDRVILSIDGRREILGFPASRSASPGSAEAIRARILTGTGQAAPGPGAPGKAALPAAGSSPDEVVEFWRRRVAANPKAVLDQLGLQATDQGYRIGTDAHPGVRRAGLQPGDMVARINGETVGNIENDRRLYDRIAAAGRARVEIIRDGQTVIMSFPLR